MLQKWADDAVPVRHNPFGAHILAHSERDAYRRMAVFDTLIGNLDRHIGNWLVSYGGRPVPIDHGATGPSSRGFKGIANAD